MAGKNSLVIVESPTKAKTIRKFLPKSFTVEASMGHIRDLPQSATEIPKDVKQEEWSKIGVNVEKDFQPLYVVPKTKSKIVAELKRKLKDADELFLATDEDREGESIAWHLFEVLKPKVPVKRMVFHEITKSAIEKSLKECRDIDAKLVRAQEARRILDRLFGYTLSPLIWKKIAFGLSAGRVQSVALRLIVERERARLRFQKANYWDMQATLKKSAEEFKAISIALEGVRIATGKDFLEETGQIDPAKKVGKDIVVVDEKKAKELVEKLKSNPWKVVSVQEKPNQARPSPPFITSTLQQEGNRKLGLSARDTMRTAQRLYEEGLITYMRTDSPNLSQEALKAARSCVEDLYGKEYLSAEVRQYTSKARGAQEAHEAIRPAGAEFIHPKNSGLGGVELALYEMIWKRTVATQMAEAKKLTVTAHIEAGGVTFSASGTRILFPGFLRAYVEGSDDPDAALEDREVLLPDLKEGEVLQLQKLEALSHETKPPARFTEAALVQTLEKEGVGRPSTYASIIGTITERGYVRREQKTLVPTFTGFAVTQLLEKNFANLVDLAFTSKMEDSLDEIAEGSLELLPYLKSFYLGKAGLQNQVKTQEKSIDPEESRTINLSHLKGVQVKVGRYGPYVVRESKIIKTKTGKEKVEEIHASLPEGLAPADVNDDSIRDLIEASEKGPQSIGLDPKSGKNVYCLVGRYGAYVQLGEVDPAEGAAKPRRSSLPKGLEPKDITLEKALELLALPRDLGVHPETKKPIVANQGRFGPYVMHDGDFRSLKKEDNVFAVTLERALEILAQEKKGRAGSKLIREVGKHPKDSKMVAIYEGKYGMYIKHAATNATLPKDIKAEELSLEKALELLAAKKKKK